ncbi:hypothetical protein C6P40_002913 [Pichia californica]|uniref:Autophagy-related protein 33 n=1 Tax=Pichia californica TaxID=460514 RepID=A0A9P6WNJ4_9ASCO|nr:hypothetical protein C6P42_002773 [[Candida] californica]KAG0690420.1 hypothetical protein C6P40_002913 [[Candida] californica]
MGKCLTIVKLVGIGSLGISSGTFLLSSLACVPDIIKEIKDSEQFKQDISKVITSLRLGFWSLGSISTYLLYQAYAKSPLYAKHPYLIYAALTFPIALIYNYYFNYSNEQEILTDSRDEIIYKKEKKIIEKIVEPEVDTSPLDNSVYNDLGNRSPKIEKSEIEVEVPVVSKVSLSSNEYKSLLNIVNKSHLYTGIILGAGFLLGSIGYIGDNLK